MSDTSISNGKVSCIYECNNNLWIGTLFRGLFEYDLRTKKGHPISLPDSCKEINLIYADRSGAVWLGTDRNGAIAYYDQQFHVFETVDGNPTSLSNNTVNAIYEDAYNTIWIGTLRGLNKYDKNRKKFKYYAPTSARFQNNGLNGNMVWNFYEDTSGILWIGTYEGGLNRYNKDSASWKYYTKKNAGLSNNAVYSICKEGDNILWLGTRSGLNKFDISRGIVEKVYRAVNMNNGIVHLLLDSKKRLWIGSRMGLYRFSKENDEIHLYDTLIVNEAKQIFEDRKGNIWVCTRDEGLVEYTDVENKKCKRYRFSPGQDGCLNHNTVYSIYEDSGGTIWVGTPHGLNKLGKDDKFSYITTKDGLPDNLIYGILEDSRGNLWLSTNKGLAKYNPKTGSISCYTFTTDCKVMNSIVGLT
jgi:ligand-binding sensor domain-containing protein